jgi:hypothetical protein
MNTYEFKKLKVAEVLEVTFISICDMNKNRWGLLLFLKF